MTGVGGLSARIAGWERAVRRRLPRRLFRIGAPAVEIVDGAHRVTWSVGGAPLWFESPDLTLAPAPEAVVAAVSPAAVVSFARLSGGAPLDPSFAAGSARAAEILADWTGGRADVWSTHPGRSPAPAAREGTAMLVSGGLDSTYNLFMAERPPKLAVFVHGFDVPVGDSARFAGLWPGIEEIVGKVGLRPTLVRTNLREHPIHRHANWEWTHGGALAAIGHLLRDHVGELVVAASGLFGRGQNWGSRWDIDPLWSSSALSVRQAGERVKRIDKFAALARDPVVARRLRVCWAGDLPGNCGRCVKCVGAMVSLSRCDALETASAFPRDIDLVERLDALAPVTEDVLRNFEDMRGDLPPPVAAALERFIQRGLARERSLGITPRRLA